MPILHRRAVFLGAAALLATPRLARAQPAGPHRLPELPYAFDANEPAIDARTMELHWGRHHRTYVNGLNEALSGQAALRDLPLTELLAGLDRVPEAARAKLRSNAGGHANHSMFWLVMGGRGGEPSGELAQAIAQDFSDFATLRNRFDAAAEAHVGSGWAFVTVTRAGRLAIATRPNQETPLMEGGRVLFGNDVWEHAYYLRYQQRRGEYLANWWNVLDWNRIAERYAAAKAGTLGV
jgi:Fe-Mn family superoxide dismutase